MENPSEENILCCDIFPKIDGANYVKLLDFCFDKSSLFCFVLRERLEGFTSNDVKELIERLAPYLVIREVVCKWPGTETSEPHPVHYYRTEKAAKEHLLEYSSALGVWLSPMRPEDLSFLRVNGRIFMESVTHEHWFSMFPTEAEYQELQKLKLSELIVPSEEVLLPDPCDIFPVTQPTS